MSAQGTAKPAAETPDKVLRPQLLAALEQAPLFQGLPRKHRHAIATCARYFRYQDGETIVREGYPGDAFYILLEGEARVERDGRDHGAVFPGDHFGELSLLDGAPRMATVVASGPAVAACVSRDDFQKLLHDEPTVAGGLLKGLTLVARDLMRLDLERIVDHGRLGDWNAVSDGRHARAEAVGKVMEGKEALGWLSLLQHVGIFEAIPERHLRRLAKSAEVERYPDGAIVVLAGSIGDSMHIILNGRARVRTPGGYSRALQEDDCFGELALLDGGNRSATVTAVGELTTARIARKEFQKLLKDEPGMAIGLLDGLVRTVRGLQQAQE
jgi:CRP-like cAMP-binding protein